MKRPEPARSTRSFRAATAGLVATTTFLAAMAAAQSPPEPVVDELVVVESSILLQRTDRTRAENLQVEIDGSLAEPVAVYSLDEVEFPTAVYFDLCSPSFSRLAGAVGMFAAIAEPMLEAGPISVVAAAESEDRVLLESSRDALSLEAALTLVLRSSLGGCEDASPLSGLARLRRGLGRLEKTSSTPSLLVLYGFDHSALTADDIGRFQPEFAAVGAELAGRGRTPIILVPTEGDRRLKQEEVEPLLGDPDGPPRTIDLAALLGAMLWPKRIVPDDSGIIGVAIDPHNELMRGLIAPGRGRLFAFPRQLEAFAADLADYHILFYRTSFRRTGTGGTLVPIEVRSRSGAEIDAARLTSRSTTSRPSAGRGSHE